MTPSAPLTAALAAAALALAGCPTATAAPTRAVSPGDSIVTTAVDGDQQCTLGYVFSSPTGRAWGITAGHCNSNRSTLVTDRTTGARGRFVLAVSDPNAPLHDDYGLIDFGANRAIPVMAGLHVTGIAAPDGQAPVCHDGVRTGVACGALNTHLVGTQWTTTGMPRSIPGDSGSPVWQLNGDQNSASIIGIWLGEHIEPGGAHYGRFTAFTRDVVADIVASAGITALHS